VSDEYTLLDWVLATVFARDLDEAVEEGVAIGWVERSVDSEGEVRHQFTRAGYSRLAEHFAEWGIDPSNPEQVETHAADIVRSWLARR
jgi:hypothetical protein